MGTHSRLSPSGSKRWMNCPGSIVLGQQCPEQKSSEAAEIGTAAHALAETYLIEGKEEYDACCFIEGKDVTPQMREAVQVYIDHIELKKMLASGKTIEGVEEKFHLGFIHEDMFGSNDYFIYDEGDKKLTVIDYKNGSGIVVETPWNSQLMIYALGAISYLEGTKGVTIKEVEIAIVQPNAIHEDGPIREWVISRDELWHWGINVLKPAALKTYEANAPLRLGEHCKFCPALAVCPKQIENATEIAKTEFSNPILPSPENLTPEDIVKVMNVSSMFNSWAKDVGVYAQAMLEKGVKLPGYKLVAKRSNRKWKDESIAAERLNDLIGDFAFEKKVLSPAKAEKALKKAKLSPEACMDDIVFKPDAGVTMAPESDKRKEVAPTATVDFINHADFLQ